MTQSLNRLFVFQRVTPIPYNSTLVVIVCTTKWAFTLILSLWMSQKRMTSGLRAFQSPPRLYPTSCFTVSVLWCFRPACSYICIDTWTHSLASALIGFRAQRCIWGQTAGMFFFLLSAFTQALSVFYLQHSLSTVEWFKSCKQTLHLNVAFWKLFEKMLRRQLLETICQCCVSQLLNVYCLLCVNH